MQNGTSGSYRRSDTLLYKEVPRTLEAEQHLRKDARSVFTLWKNKPDRVGY